MKWFSRSILVLMLAAGAGLLAFGPRADHLAPKGFTVVSYWEKWQGTEADAMRQIVSDYNNSIGKQKKIYVQYISRASVHYKTRAATAGGVPPDVAGLWPAQVMQYSLRNAAIPLDDLAREHHISPSDYKRVFWDMCNYNGHLYALPTTPAVIALHYNKLFYYQAADKLRALGLDPTRPPRTIHEFDQYAQALDVKAPDGKHLTRAGYFTMDSGWYITQVGRWFGGHAWDPVQRRYTLLDPGMIDAFEWIASYSRRMGADAFQDFRSGLGGFGSPTNPFISGTVAMTMQGPWMANYIRTYGPDLSQVIVPFELEPFLARVVRPFNYGWGVAAFPSNVPGQKDVTYAETDILMIPRGAAHPREAFEFMAYVQRQDVMEKLCRLTCKSTPLSKQSDDWIYSHPNPYVDVFERLAASPNAQPIDQTPIYAEALNEIDVAAQQTYLLEKSPRAALEGAQARIDARLRRFEQEQESRKMMDAAEVLH
jgi:ABC-type glycerol-3-phosphate transport system substrate-binding protein